MRVVVVGLGAFGLWFSRTMLEIGHEVVAIERDAALVDRFVDWASRIVEGDASDPEVLRRAGAGGADAAVICTAEDLATTLLATVALRDLGVRDVYAKVNSTNAARALDAFGLAGTIFPEREAGFRLAHRIVSKAVLDYTPIAPERSIQEIAVPASWRGKTLTQLAVRAELGVVVVAVRDALTDVVTLPPDPATPLKDSDSVIVAGSDDRLAKLAQEGE